MGSEFRNTAFNSRMVAQLGPTMGNAAVSQRDGTSGNVTPGQELVELRQQLVELRQQLEDAERQGLLDPASVLKAESSLADADQVAKEGGASAQSRLLHALNAFKASTEGLSGITAAVAAIISSIRNGS